MPKRLLSLALLLAAPSSLAQGVAEPAPASPPVARPAPQRAQAGEILVDRDTLIRLMVLNEVSTRTARPGERFVLRVDEDVEVDGITIIPVGSKAWGEVISAESSGGAGKGGKLNARLLYVEVGGEKIPIVGENKVAGEKGTKQVAMAALALGPLALLAPGNNAKLKAGEIFNAYFASDLLFDPETSTLAAAPVGTPIASEAR